MAEGKRFLKRTRLPKIRNQTKFLDEILKGGPKMITLNNSTLKVVFIACLICAGVLLNSLPLYAATYTIRIGSDTPLGSRDHRNVQKFASLVERDLGKGVVEFKFYPDSTIGSLPQQLEGLQLGTHDMTMTSGIATMVPDMGIIELPYLFKTSFVFERVMEGTSIGEELFKKCEEKGVVPLAWFENGYRHLTNNVRPIKEPSDLHDLKIRTPASPLRMQMFKAWGANPGPLSFGEVFSALQQGVFDGQENPVFLIKDSRLFEVQKYLSLTRHVYNPLPFMISKKLWDKLPANVQASMRKNAVRTSDLARDEGEKIEKEALEFLAKHMKINEVNFEAFQKASQPLYKNFTNQDLLQRVLEVAK